MKGISSSTTATYGIVQPHSGRPAFQQHPQGDIMEDTKIEETSTEVEQLGITTEGDDSKNLF